MPRELIYHLVYRDENKWKVFDPTIRTRKEMRQWFEQNRDKHPEVKYQCLGKREKLIPPKPPRRKKTQPAPEASLPVPKWRRCPAGQSFPSEAVVIYEEGPQSGEPRLTRTAIWNCRYILVSELQKLETEN